MDERIGDVYQWQLRRNDGPRSGCLKVYIDHVQVNVRSETIEAVLTPDILAQDGDLERILYAPRRDMLVSFTRDELKRYLEMKRRNVDIIMNIKITVKQNRAD